MQQTLSRPQIYSGNTHWDAATQSRLFWVFDSPSVNGPLVTIVNSYGKTNNSYGKTAITILILCLNFYVNINSPCLQLKQQSCRTCKHEIYPSPWTIGHYTRDFVLNVRFSENTQKGLPAPRCTHLSRLLRLAWDSVTVLLHNLWERVWVAPHAISFFIHSHTTATLKLNTAVKCKYSSDF